MEHQPFKYQSICSKPPTKHYHQRFVVIEFLDGTWLLKKDKQVWSKNPGFFNDINNIYDEDDRIHKKELIAEHHDEYKASKKDVNIIKDLIKRRVIDHDHLADKTDSKYGKEFKLKLYDLESLPNYIKNNINKYQNYLDLDR